jgi:hypothetical protein
MAGEQISEGALSMRAGTVVGRLARPIHAYPTWSLSTRIAAARFFGSHGGETARPDARRLTESPERGTVATCPPPTARAGRGPPGSSAAHAEHTLDAYELALDEGADRLECDVRLTRDGVLVCVHDRRIDRVSDGSGVLSTLELAELASSTSPPGRRGRPSADLQAAWAEAEQDPERRSVLTLERWSSWCWTAAGRTAGWSSCTSRPSTRRGTPGWSSVG